MAKPIRPQDVTAKKAEDLPDGVIEAFNDLIAAAWDGHQSVVAQEDAVEAILGRGVVSFRDEVFNQRLLDVEPVYRAAGWLVTYDKPGWNETYPASFIFTRRD